MGKWKVLGNLGLNIAGLLVPGVAQVEAIARSLPGMKGKQKQDALVALVAQGLLSAEAVADRDLMNNAEVEKATRAAIDAIVHLDNVVASVRAARTK